MNDKTEPWKWGDENQPKPEEPPHIEGQRHLCCGYDAYMRPFERGNWIAYEDYARLKAECQARQAENSVLAVECDSLKAEVERLTKAGDELAGWFLDYHPSAIAWNAAKEGKQS